MLVAVTTLYGSQVSGCATSSTMPSRPDQFESQATVISTGTPRRVVTYTQPGFSGTAERIGLMPFLKGRDRTNMTETHNSPLSSLSFDPDNLSPEGEEVITQYVQMALVERFGERVIPLDQVALEYDGLAKDEANDTLKTLGERSGESLGADFMVVGTVWRYRERVGGPAGKATNLMR